MINDLRCIPQFCDVERSGAHTMVPDVSFRVQLKLQSQELWHCSTVFMGQKTSENDFQE